MPDKFDGLLMIIKDNLDRATGEVYCFIHRNQKKSAQYARKALQCIAVTVKQLRKALQEEKNRMPVKKREMTVEVKQPLLIETPKPIVNDKVDNFSEEEPNK